MKQYMVKNLGIYVYIIYIEELVDIYTSTNFPSICMEVCVWSHFHACKMQEYKKAVEFACMPPQKLSLCHCYMYI